MSHTPPGRTREKVFAFVRERLLAGEPPTVREVQRALGFRAVQTARQHLEALVADGRLSAGRGRARGYRLADAPPPALLIPLLGRVPAGPLETALENPDGWISAAGIIEQPAGVPDSRLFALRVHGDSMTGAGILSGDLVVVRRQPSAADGDIVVALVGDEATVKRLRLRRGRAELHPENPDYRPLIPRAEEMQILGKVIEVRRTL